MKLPGIGEVKKEYLYAGGAAVAGIIVIGIYRHRKSTNAANGAAATAAVSATQNQDSGNIDPNTGVAYADEGIYAYGGITPTPYQDQAYQQYLEYGTQQTYSNNEAWAEAAIEYAQSDLGTTQILAQTAVADYLRQPVTGLPANEYTLMSELIALIGPPPEGTFRLHETTGGTATTGGGTGTGGILNGGNPPHGGSGAVSATTDQSIANSVGKQVQIDANIIPPNTMAKLAAAHGISLQHEINDNPGSNAGTTGVVHVPYLIKQGDTLESIASSFGIAPEHLALELAEQGVI